MDKDERIKRLERALEFYADEDNYEVYSIDALDPHTECIHPVDQDQGMVARAALNWAKAT